MIGGLINKVMLYLIRKQLAIKLRSAKGKHSEELLELMCHGCS